MQRLLHQFRCVRKLVKAARQSKKLRKQRFGAHSCRRLISSEYLLHGVVMVGIILSDKGP